MRMSDSLDKLYSGHYFETVMENCTSFKGLVIHNQNLLQLLFYQARLKSFGSIINFIPSPTFNKIFPILAFFSIKIFHKGIYKIRKKLL